MSSGVWNGAFVAICIALVTESAFAQSAPTSAPTAPPPSAAEPAPPPSAAAPGAAQPTYPPPPPQGALPPGYVYPPGYGYPPGYEYRHERRHRPHRSRGMMIAGIALFGASYVFPAVIGALFASADRNECDCRDGYRMLIPVAGPLTLLHSDGSHHELNALLITDAVLQSAGLVLTIFGIMRYVASAREEDEYSLQHPRPAWSFNAAPMPGGAYGALRLRL